jgi:hypothetical protein
MMTSLERYTAIYEAAQESNEENLSKALEFDGAIGVVQKVAVQKGDNLIISPVKKRQPFF